MNRLAYALLLAAAILFIVGPASAAGSLPAVTEMTPGGSLRPAGDSTVEVLQQNLLLDLRQQEGLMRATYRLRNQADQALELAVAVPVPPWVLGEWKVAAFLDGRPYSVRTALGPVFLFDGETDLHRHWLDPFTGEAYFPERIRDPVNPQYLIFGVAFDPGQERDLAVEYWQFPGEDIGRLIEPIRRFDYLVQPARHWADFKRLTIEVLVPNGVQIRSAMPLQTAGEGRYQATFDRLPEGNLSVFVAPGPGPGWWWTRSGRFWLLAALAAAMGIVAELIFLTLWHKFRQGGLAVSLLTWISLYALAPAHLLRPDQTGIVYLWVLMIPALMVLHMLVRSLIRRLAYQIHIRREGAGL
ncbi:MAG TPA: hypothetical protein VD969_18385 [Symbiobacteriaceae bacterium]|nr:hypothetical protein [Symbiobacteriaceae bacterium]